jgi:hypothetical protein
VLGYVGNIRLYAKGIYLSLMCLGLTYIFIFPSIVTPHAMTNIYSFF